MPEMSHANLERLVNLFNQLPPGGVCNGVTTFWAIGELSGDDDAAKFHSFLRDLNDKYVDNNVLDSDAILTDYKSALEKKEKDEPLNEDEADALQAKEFSDKVVKYQDYSNLHAELAKLSDSNISVNEVGKSVPKNEFSDYLEALRLALADHLAKGGAKVVLLHSIGDHTVGLSCSLEKNRWILMDVNRGNEKFAHCDSQVLANFLLRYKKDKLFAKTVHAGMSVFANGEVNELVQKMKAGHTPKVDSAPDEATRPKEVVNPEANQAAQNSTAQANPVETPEPPKDSPRNRR